MKYVFSQKIASLKPSAIREILKATADPSIIPFAAGNPSPEAFPVEEISEITADILKTNPIGALQYSISEGYIPLRKILREYIAENYGIGTENDELIIVSGAQQGIELTTKILCNEGDMIICENPSFVGSLNAFRSYGVSLRGVEMDDDGMNMEKLEEALKIEKKVRFIYTIPNFQNPSGITMSFEKRKKLYELAKRYNVMILEDNPYGDLRYSGVDVPSVKSLDTDGIVIYCGSFSKIISPGLRVGYILAPGEIVSKITVGKQASDVHTPALSQMIVYEFMNRYGLKQHIEKIKKIYTHKLKLMSDGLEKHLGGKLSYVMPEGGLFIYCKMPEDADMLSFCGKAVKNGVALVPGTAFLPDETAQSSHFRINYSTPTDAQIEKGVEILGRLM